MRIGRFSISFALLLCLTGCAPHVSDREAADNLRWFREHYYDAALTKALNEETPTN